MKTKLLTVGLTIFVLLNFKSSYAQGTQGEGAQWVKEQTVDNVIHSISFADSLTGYMAGEFGSVYKSTDGGANWTNVMNAGDLYYWYGIHVFSSQKAVVGGFTYKGNQNGYSVMRWTTDGGLNWTDDLVVDTTSLNWISGLDFADSIHGLATGNSGQVYITFNGGTLASDWTRVLADTTKGSFYGNFTMYPDGKYYISGSHFCTSNDYGASWVMQHSADVSYDFGVTFPDTLHGWTGGGNDLFGSNGWIHKTTDGGRTWSANLLPLPYPAYLVYFFDNLSGLAVGGNFYLDTVVGGIWSTIDGGDNWVNELNTDTDGIALDAFTYRYAASGALDMWAVGSSSVNGWHSTVYKKPGIAIPTSLNTIPSSAFLLNQNYPNPFSVATAINYSLPQAGTIDLVVYDMMGREVKKLVDHEFKQAGNYTVELNGASLSGGTCYFYNLTAGNFISTRRMIFIK